MKKEFSIKGVCNDLPFISHRNTALKGSVRQMLRSKNTTFDFDVFLPSFGVNLQRPFVWSLEQKQDFILSIIKNLSIGRFCFIIIENKDYSEIVQVIDGKQRLSSIFGFVKGLYPITVNGCDYYFNELDEVATQKIHSFAPIGDLAYSHESRVITDQEKITWFNYVNFKGTPQDAEHAQNLQKLLQ